MSSGRWQKFPEDNRNYGSSSGNYDRNRYPPYNGNRYVSDRSYHYQRLSSNIHSFPARIYENPLDYSRRFTDYFNRESNDRHRSRDHDKDLKNSSTPKNLPDKIVEKQNNTEDKKLLEDPNKKPNDKSELKPSENKRSANFLSIEDAIKSSNNQTENEEQPEKKRKLDANETVENGNEDAFHSHLKDIQTCKKDLAEIKIQIKSKFSLLEQIKTQYTNECDSLKELQIKKKTMSKKVKKMCRALAEVDEDRSDAEKEDLQITALTEIINLESNSESARSRSGSSRASCSSSVQFVNETVTINNEGEDDDESSSDDSDSDSSESVPKSTNNKIDYKLKADKMSTTAQSEKQSIKLNDKSATNQQMATDTTTTNQIKSVSSAETANNDNSKLANKLPIKEPETKNELVETTLKLENVNKETKLDFVLDFKTDLEVSLYSEIEPKLNTIVISDEEKTFIADIKIFNNRLFVGASHGLLRQYHLGTQECIKDYKGHAALVHCILPTVYPAGINRLISGGLDKILLIHDIDTGLVLNKIEEESSIFSLCDHLDFVYYGTVKGNVSTFSLEKNRKMSSFSASTSAISCLSATKEGNNHILFVGTNDGEYSMWDAITYTKLKVINPISHREIPIGFVILQKQRILAFSKNYVHFINYVKTKSSTIFNHFDPMVSICLTKNYIIIGAICGKISVYKVKSSTIQKIPIRTIINSSSPIISLTFYNNTIISGDKNGKVYFNRLVEDKSL